jgi:hypothetical protein
MRVVGGVLGGVRAEYLTVKALPFSANAEGVISPVAAPGWNPANRGRPGWSVIRVSDQRRLEIAAWRAPTSCAPARANLVEPKLASGSVRHPCPATQAEGASAIHSAELRSSLGARISFLADLPEVAFEILISTMWPLTATLARILSPGCMASASRREGAGTSSNQTLVFIAPEALQSASVPTCSSAFERTL